MSDMMPFPASWEDFLQEYSFKDKEEIYTNGSDLISVFRVRQMMEHYHHDWVSVNDRMPEKVGRYLVCTENIAGYKALENPVFIAMSFHGQWVFEGWESNRVTHWMPLPQKPESEDDTDE